MLPFTDFLHFLRTPIPEPMKSKTVFMSLCLFLFTFSVCAQTNKKKNSRLVSNVKMNPKYTISQNTEDSKNYRTLSAAMRAADLEDVLAHTGPFTVFAPSDAAFEKLSSEKITALLLPENKKKLQALMGYHIVAGNFSASNILKAMCRGAGQASFTTVQGDEITVTMDGVDIIITDNMGNTARITTADSNQSNGVIHEIDSVIRPAKI